MKQKQTIHKMPVYESDILIQEIHPFICKERYIIIFLHFGFTCIEFILPTLKKSLGPRLFSVVNIFIPLYELFLVYDKDLHFRHCLGLATQHHSSLPDRYGSELYINHN